MHRARSWARWRFVVLMWLALILVPSQVWAFCGFFASSAKADVYNDVTQVALMRHGTTTVLSMRNTYKGPVKDFAMVVPVPQVLKKEDVKTLNDDLFDRLDKLTAPRLVDYFEEDPCKHEGRTKFYDFEDMSSSSSPVAEVKASFKVGEYDVEILSAKDSTKLESWLKANGYNIPKGASKALAPYIAQGMYFFVARVDAKKVKFDKSGEAMLSPLRFAYDSEDFTLPVRLGLLNSKGKQDLSVFLLSTDGRYEVSNYPNAFIPTNLVVKEEVRHNFSAFYDALLQREFDKEPGTVVTEYAWNSPSKCDPCPPTGALKLEDIEALGRDVLWAKHSEIGPIEWQGMGMTRGSFDSAVYYGLRGIEPEIAACYKGLERQPMGADASLALSLELGAGNAVLSRQVLVDGFDGMDMEACVTRVIDGLRFGTSDDSGPGFVIASIKFGRTTKERLNLWSWVLTRLRARYSPDAMKDDLRFVLSDAPVSGGLGVPSGSDTYFPRFAPVLARRNSFQGRYLIMNSWNGELECKHPNKGIWGAESKDGEYVGAETPPGRFDPSKLSTYIIAGPADLVTRAR